MIREYLIQKLGGVLPSQPDVKKPERKESGFEHVTVTSTIEVLVERDECHMNDLGTYRITQEGTNTTGWIRVQFLPKDGQPISRFVSYSQIARLAKGPEGRSG